MKQSFRKLAAIALLLAAAPSAWSQTLNWASLTGSSIVDSQGDALDETYFFELGAFDPDFIPDETNLGQWLDNWHVFDSADYYYNEQSGAQFTGTRDFQDEPDYPAMFQGLTAYIWIRNQEGTEYFLASASDKPGVTAWTFPTLDPDCCKNGEVVTWSVSDFGSDRPIWGSQLDEHGDGTYDGSGGPYDIQTHAVPEAASSLFALLAATLGLSRRHRSRVA